MNAKQQIIDHKTWGRVDVFDYVKEFPQGYIVWNIGRQNFKYEKCIPLARPTHNYSIDLETLKYMELESEDIALKVMDAAGHRKIDKEKFLDIIK